MLFKLLAWATTFSLVLCQCPAGWSVYQNHCYKIITQNGGINFDQGNAACKAQGAHLASIHSWEENQFLNDFSKSPTPLPTLHHTLIGGQKIGPCQRDCKWTDGSKFDYHIWGAQQPDNYLGLGQNCMQLFSSNYSGTRVSSGDFASNFQRWDDVECHVMFYSAICKKAI